MKRYGDNLPSSCLEESENTNSKACYLPGNCAVRQDMVAFLMPVDVPNKHKAWTIFSFFKPGTKKIEKRGG